jgi:dTDP-glucose 4,6-dehydratase
MGAYVVTGAFGFIGSHVAEVIAAAGHAFSVLDYRGRAAVNVDFVCGLPGFRGAEFADVRATGKLDDVARMITRRALEVGERKSTVDAVLHLAAESHVDESIRAPMDALGSNAEGTARVALWCAKNDVPLVYVSTDEVYGDVIGTVYDRDGCGEDAPLVPSSPYSAGKAAGELFVRAAVRTYGLRAVILRGSNAFGPRQFGEKLIPIAVSRIHAGLPIPLHGGGEQVRQWVHAAEFAEAVMRAAEEARSILKGTDALPVYNVAGPCRMSVMDLVAALGAASGRSFDMVPVADRPGQDLSYHVRGDRAREDLGFVARRRVDSPQELEQLLAAYR